MIEDKIKEIIKKEIFPIVSRDGGDIEFDSFDKDKGIVKVRLQGACAHCPMSNITLKYTVEQLLQEKIKEVKEVVNIND